MWNVKTNSIIAVTAGVLLWGGSVLPALADKPSVSYIPAISLVPDVRLSDGTTSRTYKTEQGVTYWTPTLPVIQGDKVTLNAFVASGGSDVSHIIIRLDNTKIVDRKTAPWTATIDTTQLATGSHFVEAFAEGTGNHPQSSTKTLTFMVIKELPAQYKVEGSQEQYSGGQTVGLPMNADPTQPPTAPTFLIDKPTDEKAQIIVRSRQQNADGLIQAGKTVEIAQPTTFYFSAALDSTATQFAYVMTRNGVPISVSTKPLSLSYGRLKLQKRTDQEPGLRSGPVTLWVWGINAQGNPSKPTATQVDVP